MIRASIRITILIFIFLPALLSGQGDRGDKLYEKGHFQDALKRYLKEAENDENNSLLVHKIGLCYTQTGDYDKAKFYFIKAFTLDPDFRESQIDYANALLRTMKIDSAKQFIQHYLVSYPSDERAKGILQTLEYILKWQKETLEVYAIEPVSDINTDADELTPILWSDSLLLFISNRDIELKEFSGIKQNKFRKMNIYVAEVINLDSNHYGSPKIFLKSLNETVNNGPITFSDHSEAFINRNGFDSVMVIQSMIKNGSTWSDLTDINLYSGTYNLRHPFVTADGDTLFFSSDRPGGYGKLDLYYSVRQDSVWSEPINLGPTINTSENEAFPTCFNGVFYFSSNGRIGFGGYDIYSANSYRNPTEINNVGYPVNSSSDDFYLFFRDHKGGYFSSNRPKGQGGDDIYAFKRRIIDPNTTSIHGKVEYNEVAVGNAKVNLLDEQNQLLKTIITNPKGEFIFEDIGINTQYSFVLNTGGKPDTLNSRFYMLNSKGEKVVILLQNIEGEFAFESLPAEEYDNLPLIEENTDLLTIRLKGQVVNNKDGDAKKRVVVYVLNENNLVIAKGYTDENGNFSIANLPPKDQYTIKIAEHIEDAKIVILEKGDRILTTKNALDGNEFVYTRLEADENYITLLNESGETVKVKLNENFEVDNIYYDYNSWEINAVAAKSLEKLVRLLKRNPHIGIDLYSHTDSRASDQFNLQLSQKRAESAKNYLIERGISPERITAVGRGESELVNGCSDGVECSEMQHAENRRTEFEVKNLSNK